MGQLVSGGGQTSPSSLLGKNAAYVVGLHHAGLRPLCWPHRPRTARPLHITYRRTSFIKQESGSTERCQGHTEHVRMRTWEHAGRSAVGAPFFSTSVPGPSVWGPSTKWAWGRKDTLLLILTQRKRRYPVSGPRRVCHSSVCCRPLQSDTRTPESPSPRAGGLAVTQAGQPCPAHEPSVLVGHHVGESLSNTSQSSTPCTVLTRCPWATTQAGMLKDRLQMQGQLARAQVGQPEHQSRYK